MEIPFVGGAYKGRSTNINAQVCQNLYPVLDQEGGKVLALMNTPGLDLWCTPVSGPVRGLRMMGSYLYAVIGAALYRIDSLGTSLAMTGALLTATGPVYMADNGTQLMIVDGTAGYILSGVTLSQIVEVLGVKATGTLTSDATEPAVDDTVTIDGKVYTFKSDLTPYEGEVLIKGFSYNYIQGNGLVPANGDTVTIDGKVYTFRTAPTWLEGEVLIGANWDACLVNLKAAINHLEGEGTLYSCVAAHPTVEASVRYPTNWRNMKIQARVNGVAGDGIVCGSASANYVWFAAATYGGSATGAADTLANLEAAIMHTGTPGTDYECAAAHPTVESTALAATTIALRALTEGTDGNAIATTETSAHLSFGAATLTGGVDPTAGDFVTPQTVTYQDGYFIVSMKDSGRFYISESYDGMAWDPLDYATAEGDPDYLVSVVSANRELWLIGQRSYEVWYNSGAAAFPFERIGNTFNRIGCGARASVAEHQGVVCWLDNFRFIRSSQGYIAGKISTPQIDYQISQYAVVSDAIGYMYSQEGHTFYVITFPTENKTWAYDFSTQLWHTRASGILDIRHPPNCYAFYEGMHITGDPVNGNLYKYNLSTYTDNGETVRRVRTAQPLVQDRKNVFHHALELEFEGGVGIEPVGASLVINPATLDTYLREDAAGTNYGAATNVAVSASNVAARYRSILRFDFSALPDDAIITAANLWMYLIGAFVGAPNGRTYWAYELDNIDWVELEATWNSYKTGSAWTAAGGDFVTALGASAVVTPTTTGWMSWNVLDLITHFQGSHGKIANILIKDGDELGAAAGASLYSRDYVTDLTLRPRLEIAYYTNPGTDPQAMLEWSDDGGHTWSNEHWVSIGKIGEYKKRAIWRRLGRSRDRIYRVTLSDPVKTVIIGAHLEATPGTV